MNKLVKQIIPVILCGGTGSRLWPLSRQSFPKQYLDIKTEESISFLQGTIQRLRHGINITDPILVCSEEHRFIVAEQMRSINVKPKSILLEPFGRNTAPAITVAAIKAMEMENNPILLVLPSDHIIKNEEEFLKVIYSSIDYANSGNLVALGIIPDRPETGYGYIEASRVLCQNDYIGEKINKFIEKPDKSTAEKFIKDKRFTWNSGIFIFKASSVLNQIKLFSPNIFAACKKSLSPKNIDLEFERIDKKEFFNCENISFDKAIMEKTNLGIVLPLNVGWNDIGSWESMWQVSDKDKSGNLINGNVVVKNVSDSYIRSESRLTVGIGLENLVIIETNDALLICDKGQTQFVKGIVEKLKSGCKPEATSHKTVFRPWGQYTSISEGTNWQVKKISVKPGESLSLQLHNQRTEHWVVVSGTALVEINEEKKIIKKNESTYIPLSAKHRLSNPGNVTLILIEIQSGDYLGEDDIIRFADNYGRI